MRKTIRFLNGSAVALVLATTFMVGCTTYFRVADLSTDQVYYTKKVKKLGGGAIRIKDARTGSTLSLQNSNVTRIKKDEYKRGVWGSDPNNAQ